MTEEAVSGGGPAKEDELFVRSSSSTSWEEEEELFVCSGSSTNWMRKYQRWR